MYQRLIPATTLTPRGNLMDVDGATIWMMYFYWFKIRIFFYQISVSNVLHLLFLVGDAFETK